MTNRIIDRVQVNLSAFLTENCRVVANVEYLRVNLEMMYEYLVYYYKSMLVIFIKTGIHLNNVQITTLFINTFKDLFYA